MQFQGLKPIQMYCPNCGKLIIGYKREDGAVLIECTKCKVVIFSKQRNAREIAIKMTAPY